MQSMTKHYAIWPKVWSGLIDVAKNEKDVVELLKKLLHPAELAKMMERDPSLEEFKRRFNESNRFEMLEGLLSIDVRRPRCRKA